ncbi:MAG: hypothetical protein IID08_04495 [Candidatus Hydrogenedentes bacterium]|nr:hypothetical protein [Candidatus Hydrogenedentota bacterium]
MNMKRLAAICAICVIIALSLTLFAAVADAQKDSSGAKSSDKKVSQKRGVSGALADADDDDDGLGPSKLQMGVGVGSIFVMIGVMKYL